MREFWKENCRRIGRMIEAGFRRRTFSAPDDIDAAAATLKRRFGDRLSTLIGASRRDGAYLKNVYRGNNGCLVRSIKRR
jgi:hypothetical protein